MTWIQFSTGNVTNSAKSCQQGVVQHPQHLPSRALAVRLSVVVLFHVFSFFFFALNMFLRLKLCRNDATNSGKVSGQNCRRADCCLHIIGHGCWISTVKSKVNSKI